MKKFLTILIMVLSISLYAQDYNLTLVGQLDYDEDVNDIWGYVDSEGTEYAIMGLFNGTAIISLEDPTNPTEVGYIQGGGSTWRDMKSYGNYVYVTTEASDGILIIDMSDIHNGNYTSSFYTPEINGNTLTTIHNLYIDENGFMYIAGGNVSGGGELIFDTVANPTEPVLRSVVGNNYSHDVYARNDTLWSSNINQGVFTAIDVSDKDNPQILNFQETDFSFCHNAWLSDDGSHIFTTDELGNAPIGAYNVSDVNNIYQTDSWVPPLTAGQGVVPHNVHVYNDYLVISYYTDGVKVVDASRPTNLVEVGSYDTYPNPGGGTNGCWGAYPFLPSGLILASDINSGLFVLEPNYQRACFLEGTITDVGTQVPVNNVTVVLNVTGNPSDESASNGTYGIGTVSSGTYEATFSAVGYLSQTVTVTLVNGQVTIQDVELIPVGFTDVSGQVVRVADGTGVEGAIVRMTSENGTFNTTTDANGNFNIPEIYQGEYDVYAGKWGHTTETEVGSFWQGNTNTVTIAIDEGYEDPFAVDLGWTVFSNAWTGDFELGEPVGTFYQGGFFNPEFDTDDLGDWCYTTGNGSTDSSQDDVDGGTTRLISPIFDLTSYDNPYVSFQVWFMNAGGNGQPDDELTVYLDNGNTEVLLDVIDMSTFDWSEIKEYRVSNFLQPTENMELKVETSDLQGSGHLVEAAFDNFAVYNKMESSTQDISWAQDFILSPNPASSFFNINVPEVLSNYDIRIFDVLGRVVYQEEFNYHQNINLDTKNWAQGVYQVSLRSGNESFTKKIVIQ